MGSIIMILWIQLITLVVYGSYGIALILLLMFYSKNNFIHMLVLVTTIVHNFKYLHTDQSVWKTVILAPSHWINAIIDKPWCIFGDFNELEESADKKGERLSLLHNVLNFWLF